jgi:hypothetical protein
MSGNKTILNNIVSVLIRIDHEGRKPNINAVEFNNCGQAISKLLKRIEDDFGIDFMIEVFIITTKQLNHTLGPLDVSILKKLMLNGFEINSINKVAQCN